MRVLRKFEGENAEKMKKMKENAENTCFLINNCYILTMDAAPMKESRECDPNFSHNKRGEQR